MKIDTDHIGKLPDNHGYVEPDEHHGELITASPSNKDEYAEEEDNRRRESESDISEKKLNGHRLYYSAFYLESLWTYGESNPSFVHAMDA